MPCCLDLPPYLNTRFQKKIGVKIMYTELEPCYYCSVAKLCLILCNPIDYSMPVLPCPSLSPRVCSNSCLLSQWCHVIISSSVAPFPSCLQSFPASGSFPMSQFFASDGQSIGASESVLSMNIQGWFPLGLTGFVSLQSKGLSRVFSSTTVPRHLFFGNQPNKSIK